MRITIADNGVGISDENKRKLFAPFFTTKVGRRDGLGLWITKDLLEEKVDVCCSAAQIPAGRDCNDDLSAFGIAGRGWLCRQLANPPRLCKCACRIGLWNDRFSRFIPMLALALQLLWVHIDRLWLHLNHSKPSFIFDKS
jgi:hypothetical protein